MSVPGRASAWGLRAPKQRLTAVSAVMFVTVVCVALGFLGVSRWLTAPLRPLPSSATTVTSTLALPAASHEVQHAEKALSWPERTLDGDQAKRLLLRCLVRACEQLQQVDGYTAIFHKQERIAGALGKAQTLELKIRQRPFAIYLKFLEPEPGKEVLFAEGHFDNKMIAHGAGLSRRLLPRLALAPTSPLALAENRHPITDAGLLKLTRTLIRFREIDLHDTEAVTILDRTHTADGRPVLRSLHTHPHRHPERPFARVEVLYDPISLIPIEITSFDWPAGDQAHELQLAEHYAYENLKLTASLSDADFDPANPDYAFRRY